MAQTMEEASEEADAFNAQQIEDLNQQLQAATTEEEKEEISTQIEDLELEDEINVPNPFLAMNNPTMNLYGIIDGSTGLLFNLIMFVTGVGLLLRKEWARKLAIWTAALKIVRLLILQSINMVYIIPIQAKSMQEMFKQMDVGGQGQGPDMSQMASMQGGMMMAWAVVMLIAGCVYPALSIWFLSRPGVQATCQLENIESDQVE